MSGIVPSAEDPLVSVREVARTFDVTPYTVREWLKADMLKGTKIGSQWRILRSEMVRFANEQYGAK